MSGHRPRRDSQSNVKEFNDLRRENNALKRQVSRLQSYVTKLLGQQATVVDPESEELVRLDTSGVQCPECNGPLTTVNLGIKTLRGCKGCGWRKVS